MPLISKWSGTHAIAALLVLQFACSNALGSDFFTQVPHGKFSAVGRILVRYRNEKGEEKFSLGSGALINSRTVLTAAHMLNHARVPTDIYFQVTDKNGKEFRIEQSDGQKMLPRAIAFRSHPRYLLDLFNQFEAEVMDFEDRNECQRHDVALLLLEREIPKEIVDTYPELAPLPTSVGTVVEAVGFGRIESMTNAQGLKRSGKLEFLEKTPRGAIFRTPPGQLQRANHGDSGGPLFITKEGKHQIVAITQGGGAERFKGLDIVGYAYFAAMQDNQIWLDSARSQLDKMRFDEPRYFYLPRNPNVITSQLQLSAQQILGLLSIDVDKDRVIERVFYRGVNEPIPVSVAEGWLRKYNKLDAKIFIPIPLGTGSAPGAQAK